MLHKYRYAVEPGRALSALNFFLADVRDGLGPYLAIYLLSVRGPEHGWDEASIGLVVSIASFLGLLSFLPAGYIIDKVPTKRLIIGVATVLVTVSCSLLPFLSSFGAIAFTQALSNMAGSIFAPAVAGISLGIVGPRNFAKRIGKNEAYNHAGNAFSAVMAAIGAHFFGAVVVFWLMAALTIFSLISLLLISPDAINPHVMQGVEKQNKSDKPLFFSLLKGPLLLVALLMAYFILPMRRCSQQLGSYCHIW